MVNTSSPTATPTSSSSLSSRARQAGVRFARVALAAGELPEPLEVHALLALSDQKAAVAFDDGGADDDAVHGDFSGLNGNERQLLAIGQIRHLGFRATHTIAPKSISA